MSNEFERGGAVCSNNLHICFLNHSVPLKKQDISMIGGLECLRKATLDLPLNVQHYHLYGTGCLLISLAKQFIEII